MAKVTRFFHIRPNLNNGGATVKVTGDNEHVGQVDVQVAFCHTFSPTDLKKPEKERKGDRYVKDAGRYVASTAPVKVVPLRRLPEELRQVYEQAFDRAYPEYAPCIKLPDYSFAMKYFLPKE